MANSQRAVKELSQGRSVIIRTRSNTEAKTAVPTNNRAPTSTFTALPPISPSMVANLAQLRSTRRVLFKIAPSQGRPVL